MIWCGVTKSLGKAFRPKPDSLIQMDRRRLHPAEQEEIKRRVAMYAKQVDVRGQITWLPHRGSGQSVSEGMAVDVECAAESAV